MKNSLFESVQRAFNNTNEAFKRPKPKFSIGQMVRYTEEVRGLGDRAPIYKVKVIRDGAQSNVDNFYYAYEIEDIKNGNVRTVYKPNLIAESLNEAQKEGGGAEYKKYFATKLKDAGYKSIDDIPSDKKDDFFNSVDKGWKADNEGSNESINEAGTYLDEITVTNGFSKDAEKDAEKINDWMYDQKWSGNEVALMKELKAKVKSFEKTHKVSVQIDESKNGYVADEITPADKAFFKANKKAVMALIEDDLFLPPIEAIRIVRDGKPSKEYLDSVRRWNNR